MIHHRMQPSQLTSVKYENHPGQISCVTTLGAIGRDNTAHEVE